MKTTLERYVILSDAALAGERPELVAALREAELGELGGEREYALDCDCAYEPGRPGRSWGRYEDSYPDEPATVSVAVRCGAVALTDEEIARFLGDESALQDSLLAEIEQILADEDHPSSDYY